MKKRITSERQPPQDLQRRREGVLPGFGTLATSAISPCSLGDASGTVIFSLGNVLRDRFKALERPLGFLADVIVFILEQLDQLGDRTDGPMPVEPQRSGRVAAGTWIFISQAFDQSHDDRIVWSVHTPPLLVLLSGKSFRCPIPSSSVCIDYKGRQVWIFWFFGPEIKKSVLVNFIELGNTP